MSVSVESTSQTYITGLQLTGSCGVYTVRHPSISSKRLSTCRWSKKVWASLVLCREGDENVHRLLEVRRCFHGRRRGCQWVVQSSPEEWTMTGQGASVSRCWQVLQHPATSATRMDPLPAHTSLRDIWRHFGLCRAAAHIVTGDFFAPCINILTYFLTYLPV